ncbi:progestin and adipoQ receptor family member 4 isoform X1 [Aedes aegypti]|uniref:Putative progestin and adipoq receptor family member 4 n=1 Tax=Aedes aegypti TaxID=7159 RepID=A0A0P6ITR0_AEDAE|nr:progestin and adipoQ receptor family member 4 isoform X1 [Aedes aegypti]XP_021694746.1 progestin and adipoQ receptor family member 4 isoform X1 [Aedes aegypti]
MQSAECAGVISPVVIESATAPISVVPRSTTANHCSGGHSSLLLSTSSTSSSLSSSPETVRSASSSTTTSSLGPQTAPAVVPPSSPVPPPTVLKTKQCPRDDFGEDDDEDGQNRAPLMKQLNKLLTPPDDLLQWKDMPQHLQFNPYVLTGYRPLQGVKGCLSSLFYVHNETINILTHGIPIVYILATVPAMMPWEKEYRFLSWCHLVGSVAPWCGSFVYHLFMNLELGESAYYRLLQLDMLGIWISQSFGALPMVTATVYCLGWPLKWLIIISYSMLCIWGLYKAMTASSPWQRRLCFLLPFMMRIMLTLLRISKLGGGNPSSLTHVFLQDAVSAVGGVIGAMHIPEKWFPGSVDIYLNSHNIMHVLVVMAVYSMHQATIRDIEWMQNAECSRSNLTSSLNIDAINGSHLEL